MNNLMEKARTGRTKALAQRQGLSGAGMQNDAPTVSFKTSRRTDTIAFVSTRTQVPATAWLH